MNSSSLEHSHVLSMEQGHCAPHGHATSVCLLCSSLPSGFSLFTSMFLRDRDKRGSRRERCRLTSPPRGGTNRASKVHWRLRQSCRQNLSELAYVVFSESRTSGWRGASHHGWSFPMCRVTHPGRSGAGPSLELTPEMCKQSTFFEDRPMEVMRRLCHRRSIVPAHLNVTG